MGKLKLMTIIGTRPEIIRLSATIKCCDRYFEQILVHTGQNYDYTLNQVFFDDLGLRAPDYYLDAVGDDLGATIGNIIEKSYKLMVRVRPDAVLVLGEKNNPNGVQDASLVMGNLMLAASGIGLGSCWINRAKETFETPEGKALLAKWGLDPEKYIGVGYCILGYPAPNGTRTPGPRKAGYVLHV